MSAHEKSREELFEELQQLRQRVAQMEKAAESTQAAVALLRVAPLGIHECDTEGRITFVNPLQQAITGYTADELLGTFIWERMEPGPLKDAFPGYLKRLVAEQPAATPFFARNLRKNGEAFEARIDWNYKRDLQGRVTGFVSIVSDIHDLKRVEEALRRTHDELGERVQERTAELQAANARLQHEIEERRRAESTLNAFFNASTVSLNILDEEFRYIKTDNLTPTYFGLDAQSIVGRSLKDDLAPEFIDEFGPMIRRVIETGEPVHDIEVKGRTPGPPNRTVYWRASYFPLPLPDGRRGYGVVGMEVSDIKHAQEALSQSHDQLQAIYDGMVDGLLMADVDAKRFVRANAAMCRMVGYSEEELLSLSVQDLHPPAELPRVLEDFQALADGKRLISDEIPVLRKDGSVFHAVISTSRVVYADRRCVVGFFRDITERKQAELALRQSHDQLQAIYDGMVEGLLITDIQTTRIRRVNSSMCRMLGYREEELLSRSIPDLHPPEAVTDDMARFQAAAEGRVSINEDRPVLRKDGSLFYADITGHRIVYEGRPCLLALFRDVSERRHAQAALHRQRRTLEHLLRASDYERQLIAYDIHDGLAQQLAGAIMQLQTYDHLKTAKGHEAAQAFQAGLALLRQGHSEARRIISGVRAPILDEAGIVAAIAHLVHEPPFDRGPKIHFRSRVALSRLAPVLENTIYRIVQEGLTNACKHSKAEEVYIRLLQNGDRMRIEIKDSGVGFDLKTVRQNRYGLLGIRERARVLGGRCRIRTQPGQGTAVIVELPLAELES